MSRSSGRLVSVLILTYLAGFSFFLLLSLFQFPAREVLPIYYWSWVFANAFALLIGSAIPLQITSMFLGFSLVIHEMDVRSDPRAAGGFPSLVRVPIMLLLILTLVYVFALEWILPSMVLKRDTYVYNTALSRELYKTAEQSYKKRNYEQALSRIDQFLLLNPKDEQGQDLRRAALARAPVGNNSSEMVGGQEESGSSNEHTSTPSPSVEAPDTGGLSGSQLLARGVEYFQKEDYFSSYYYASLALRVDPRLSGATRLQSRSLDGIQQIDLSRMEKKRADIYKLKRQGFLDLESGDPIDAYYIFAGLSRQVPDDLDVQRYLASASDAVQRIAFFMNEVNGIVTLPGLQHIMFVNQRTSQYTELIYMGKLVDAPEGVYALDVELMRFAPGGRVILHLMAPYAKVVNQHLILHGIDRRNANLDIEPTVYVGTIPKATGPIFPLLVPVDDLRTIAAGSGHLESVGTIALWSSLRLLEKYGYSVGPIYLELLMRLLLPFTFVVLSLFSISFAWRMRSRYLTRPPIIVLLLIPIIPFVVNYGFRLYTYCFRLVLGVTQLYAGFTLTLIVLVVTQGVLLILALLSLAGQSAG